MAIQVINAKGLSGKNIDYVNALDQFLKENNIIDAHVFELEEEIKKILYKTKV